MKKWNKNEKNEMTLDLLQKWKKMKYGRGAGSLILGIRSPLQFDDSIALLANQNYLILVG